MVSINTGLKNLIKSKLFVDSSGNMVEPQATLAIDGKKWYEQIKLGIK